MNLKESIMTLNQATASEIAKDFQKLLKKEKNQVKLQVQLKKLQEDIKMIRVEIEDKMSDTFIENSVDVVE